MVGALARRTLSVPPARELRVPRGTKAFSETDFTEDLKRFEVPTLILHGDDDQIVPIAASLSAKLVKNSTLKIYPGFPHEMPTTNADTINSDLLALIRKSRKAAA